MMTRHRREETAASGPEKRMQYRILVVDDEPEWLDILSLLFTRKGWDVQTAPCGEAAWTAMGERSYDLVLCDLSMPDISGIELLKRVRAVDSVLPFVIMTGVGTIETAVQAVQLGAYSYITKPFKTQELEIVSMRAVEHGRMHRQLEHSKDRDAESESPFIDAPGRTMQEVLATVKKVADSQVPVLIQGETGTGKSLLATHIHKISQRREMPFLTIDCGALPETLLESELFGHVKGAFTGAVFSRRGLLEEAQGGTVFLDEIGELTLATQAKLLRAIQEHEIRPVGGNKPVTVDVRFITATNRNLQEDVIAGRFREDLYYRLAVIPIVLPPLRERTDEMTSLIAHFIKKFNERYCKSIAGVSPAAMQMLFDQPWKGNIRELENVLERAVLLAGQDMLTPDTLGLQLPAGESRKTAGTDEGRSLQQTVQEAERRAIEQALRIAGGNRTQAAAMLGIGRRTLYDKLEEYGLETRKAGK